MKRHLGKLIALGCGGLMMLLSVLYQMPVSGTREWLRILSNGALMPGFLLTGLGVMLRISEEGLFDGIRYATSSLLARVRGLDKKYPSYYDFTRREKKVRSASPLLLPGVFYLAAAVVLTVLYYFV